jgi:hypothetical protein
MIVCFSLLYFFISLTTKIRVSLPEECVVITLHTPQQSVSLYDGDDFFEKYATTTTTHNKKPKPKVRSK